MHSQPVPPVGHAAPAHQRRLPRAWLAGLLVLLLGSAAVLRLQALTRADASLDLALRAPALPTANAAAATPTEPLLSAAAGLQLLRRFPLNALLLPLMDDAEPPRWTTVSLQHQCGPGTRVLVDGQPLQSGAPVPDGAFRLQWQMDGCQPLGAGALVLSGGVALTVFRDGTRLTALVQPQQLLVEGPDGPVAVAGGFTASAAWR